MSNAQSKYLERLPNWDGPFRIERMAHLYFGIEGPLGRICSMLLLKWMIGAVARAMNPGVRFDPILVLVGPQGGKKSLFFKTLVPETLFGQLDSPSPENKDTLMTMQHLWVLEWPEAQASNDEGTKSFLSSTADRFLPAYEKEVRSIPRTSVIVGTTNSSDFLQPGSRRWWPIPVRNVHLEALKADREQLWAEALSAYREHVPFWLNDDEEKGLRDLIGWFAFDGMGWFEALKKK